MLHSGSRNIGKRICDYFNKIACDLNRTYYSATPENIGFLPINTIEGEGYLAWMYFAMGFGQLNRTAMSEYIMKDLRYCFKDKEIHFEPTINIHHNYASLENHHSQNVWVHRKGATLASTDTVGIIPGSMGSASYIVQGLGNKESLNSCSHGAGRRMGRKVFNTAYNTVEKLQEIENTMKGITYTKFGKATSRKGKDLGMLDISEAPQAYKDIDEVMENQKDLVKPIVKLHPIINWKDSGEE